MAALKARAQALANSFGTLGSAAPGTVDPAAWKRASTAIDAASKSYRAAASSSGLLNTQQVRTNSEVKRYTELMSKQKLGMRDMLRNNSLMKEAYRDQLRMQRMTAQHWGTDTQGRQVIDVTTPKNVPKDLDTIRNKVGFISQGLKSAGHEMINFGKNTQWAGRQLMVGFTMPVAIFGALAGTLAYQVDKELTRVTKVYDVSTDSMIDKERELNNLRVTSMKLAKDAANAYGAAATDTLKVEAELAATGMTGTDLIDRSKQVVRIATLGELDFDKSTQMAITLGTSFRDTIKDSNDLSNAFNYLNALENSTSLSLADMTEAIPRAASGFAQLGGTVKDLGVVMTAMKESGIDPATGANAVKSASTRIINPTKAALEFYKQQDIDLNKLRDKSGGNLFAYLKLLGEEQQKIQEGTEKDTKLMRARGVAMLFGTYQNTRMTAALTNIADAYAGVHNQASKALEVGKMTNKELSAIAEGEIAQKMSSASGQFDKAIQSIKLEVADMGKPFLDAATDILGILQKMVGGFNSLSPGTKKFIMWAAIITAVIGPMIMLTGLFFNLAGHLVSAAGGIGTLVTRFKFMTEEQRLAKITTDAINESLKRQSTPINTLKAELGALAGAYAMAANEAQAFLRSSVATAQAYATSAKDAVAQRLAIIEQQRGSASPTGASRPPMTAGLPLSGLPLRGARATPTDRMSRAEIGRLLGQPYQGAPNGSGSMAGISPKVNKNGQVYFNQSGGRRATKEQIAAYRSLATLQTKINLSETKTAALRASSAESMKSIVASSRKAAGGRPAVLGTGATSAFSAGTRAPKSDIVGGAPFVPPTKTQDTIARENAALKNKAAGLRMINGLRSGEQKIVTQTNGTLVAQKAVVDKTTGAQKENAKTLHSGAKAAGAMQLAMAASMVTSGGLQKVLMGTTTALFALSSAQQLNITGKIADQWKGGVSGAGKFKSAGSKALTNLTTGAKRFGAALLGPWGLAAAAAVGLGYLLYKHMKAPERQQEAINRSVNTWADTLGVVKKKYDALNLSMNNYSDGKVSPEELSKRLTETDDGKALVSSMKDGLENNQSYADMLAAQEYIKILTQTNATAEDAQRAIEALFLASGQGFFEAAQSANDLRGKIGDVITGADTSELWSAQIKETLDASSAQFDERAKGIGQMLNEELKRAANPQAADKVLVRFSTAFDGVAKDKWMEKLPADVQDAFKKAGKTGQSGMDFITGWKEVQDSWAAAGAPGVAAYGSTDAEKALSEKLANLAPSRMDDAVNSMKVQKELIQYLREELGIKESITSIDDLRATEEWQTFLVTKKNAKELIGLYKRQAEAALNRSYSSPNLFTQAEGQMKAAHDLELVNARLRRVGLPEIDSLHDKINWKMLKEKETQRGINEETDKGKNKLSAALKVWKEFQSGGWKEASKSAWQNVTSAVSGQLSSNFDSMQQRAMSNLEAGQERATQRLSRSQEQATASMEKAQEAASNALDRRIESREKALDARGDRISAHFDHMTEKANAYYDHRIAGVNRAIDAEQKADEIRQKLFDREMTRIQRLADAQNRNIDFNVAVNQGNFDEAAKIQNDGVATESTNAYEDAGNAADAASQKRQDQLQKQIDRLEKRRDARLKNIDAAREGAEKALQIDRDRAAKSAEIARANLEKKAEMERAALEKSQERQRKAQEARQAAQKEELEKQQARSKASFELQLALLNAYIPRSEKDLRQHMNRLAGEYNEFGKAYAKTSIGWGKFIKDQMTMQMKTAATNLKSEVNWAGAGHDAGQGMINGMAASMGMSAGEFRKWLGVGDGGKRPGGSGNKSGKSSNSGNQNKFDTDGRLGLDSHHEGGLIGRGGSGRTGFSGSQSAHSEKTINAKVGEFMMKDKAVKHYGVDTFNAMNEGKLDKRFGIGGMSGTMGNFMLGAAGTLMAKAMVGAIKAKAQEAVAAKVASEMAVAGSYGMAGAGKYGGTMFNAEQLKNASTIASVGRSLGASQRDIQIALMTAMQESTLRNLSYGDRDSVGLFQQRDAWGSFAERTNPAASARMFFQGGHQGQRGLFDFKDRGSMSLAQAAQSVQVSAYPDAYAKWADEASAILAAMVKKGSPAGAGGTSGGFVQGSGGRHRPTRGGTLTQGLHPTNAIDIGVPVGTPAYAAADGRVSGSYDIKGYEPRQAHGGLGYRSYGRVITIDHGGFSTLYAHLSRRSVNAGTQVRGGATIGATGNTGNSSGPHLHFGAPGSNPYAFLKTGGTIKYDNTPAILHRDERVLSAPLTSKLDKGLDNLSNGPMHVTIDLRGAYIKEEIDIRKAVYAAIDERDGRVGRKRIVK